MKKLLFLPLTILTILCSCQPIETTQELNEYTNCVMFSIDTITSVETITDEARIKVIADGSTATFQLELQDFKLQPYGNLESVNISGLIQYLKDVTNSTDNSVEYLYTFFKTDGYATTNGLDVRDLRFGWLSTIYWGTFASGQNRVWTLPQKLQTYANKNTIVNGGEQTFTENAIHPRYDMELDIDAETITIRGTAVTLPVTNKVSDNIVIRDLRLENIPVRYNYKGFTASLAEVAPLTDGSYDQYKITDFNLIFDADYDGTHEARYYLTDLSTGFRVRVVSTFGYNNNSNI